MKNSKVRTVLTSHKVLGGAATSELLATTVAFHDANPVLSGLSLMPSRSSINSDRKKAAQVYLEEARAPDAPEDIEKIISPYSVVPSGIMKAIGSRLSSTSGCDGSGAGRAFRSHL